MDAHHQPRSLALTYIDAVGHRDFDRVAELLHPDVEFVTSGPPIRGQQAFVAALRRLAPILVRNDVRATIADGNDVAVFYDFVTDTPAGAVQTIEWITTIDGRIRTSRLIFDKEHWPAALAELARRSTIAA
ncbi:MAG TPA: nuclear transport factor 2 family protein [Tepidiformaceae bacterium]|nr:nuclear transport factor 2 family protein [Tepidiformaceae bacterium]